MSIIYVNAYIDILIFGVIAIFLIFRLKNILGQNSEGNNQNNKKRVAVAEVSFKLSFYTTDY